MADEKNFDAGTEWSRIKTRAVNVRDSYGERRTLFNEMENVYFMELADEKKLEGKLKGVKIVKSPDGRNQAQGAMRLLRVGEATWSIPREKNDQAAKDASEPLERFALQMYNAASRVSGVAPHEEGATSLVLYDECHIAVISTQDIVAHLERVGKSGAYLARAKRVAQRTPYLFECWNPKDCYPVFDGLGLAAHYRETISQASKIAAEWGTEALPDEFDPTDEFTLCEWWDLENHAVWLLDQGDYIMCEPHGLEFIPIAVAVGEGSTRLFSDPDKQRQPFLYTFNKSGMFDLQSLGLSVMGTQVFGLGSNPMFVYQARDEDKQLNVDWSIPGGVLTIEQGESFGQVQVKPINADLQYFQQLLDQKGVEATMYRQALGEGAGSGQAFSSLALLSQAGRLPLAGPKKRLGWVLGHAMQIAYAWMKSETTDGGKRRAKNGYIQAEIEIGQIPDDFEIECVVDVSLPQDKMQQVNIAKSATDAPNGQIPLASRRWAREEVLGIEQSSEMDREIMNEIAGTQLFAQYLEMMAQQAAAAQQGMQSMAMPPMGGAHSMSAPPGMQTGAPPMAGPPMAGAPMAGPAIGEDGSLPGERMMGMDDGGLPPEGEPML